jgi:Zinc carboxypeptidase
MARISLALCFVFLCQFSIAQTKTWPDELLTTPEKTNYGKTSTYADVMSFLKAQSAVSKDIRVVSIGKSLEGKDIPLAIVSRPLVTSPEEARATGKLVVYIQGNIHAGEVEGKEVVMMKIREILSKEKEPLLDNLIILFCPIYNTDSNDQMAVGRRPSQENSPMEVGIRENSQGLDLNRDGIKMEAIETNGLLSVINQWDPQLFVDLHTTNGTWHGWDLTWAPSYHYAGEKEPYDFTVQMLRHISTVVGEKYKLGFGPFGDFYLREGWPVRNFYTYNHHPRYLVNQFGLRNRMAILSESFAHEPFEKRIYSTNAFVTEILNYASDHANEIKSINKNAENATMKKYTESAGTSKKGVRYVMVQSEVLNSFPAYDYQESAQADGTPEFTRKTSKVLLNNVAYHGGFRADVESIMPRGYIIPGSMVAVVENLRKHGIRVDALKKKHTYTGAYFELTKYEKAQRKFEGHLMARATGKFIEAKRKFGRGSYVVDLSQPLGNLAFYMLEPESDDGLVNWNFFDESIEKQKQDNKPMEYPVFKYYITK